MDVAVPGQVRLDKWLWAARFFKTRTLAAQAVSAGHVHLNGRRVKPSKSVALGDCITIQGDLAARTVHVQAVALRRGPASEAAKLYEETAESRGLRERAAAERRALRMADRIIPVRGAGRPSKRDRRRMERFRSQRYDR